MLQTSKVRSRIGCSITALGTGTGCSIQDSIKGTAETVQKEIVVPIWKTAVVQGLLNISQFVVNRLAYEAAVMVATGGPGQDSLFYGKSISDGWKDFGLEIAGKAVEELNDQTNEALGTKFNICAPSGSIFALGLAIGIQQKYQPKKPRCDITEVVNNWGSFTSEVYSTITDPDKASEVILSKFAESLKPGRNELSSARILNSEISRLIELAKETDAKDRQATRTLKDVTDPGSGKVTTPGKIVEDDFLTKESLFPF